MAREPELTPYGFGVFDFRGEGRRPGWRAETLRQEREKLRGQLNSFVAARAWLRRFPRLKRVNRRRGTSYGLKHVAEREIGYLTNGVFIAAAIAEGFVVRRIKHSPNARIGISSSAWRWERGR
jgi:hypothetical protein